MNLDFSLIQDPKVAVFCATKGQADAFCREMKRQYPERMVNWRDDNYWSLRYTDEEGICFSPYLNGDKSHMTWCSLKHYINNGFRIIEFENLGTCEDIQFDESQFDVLFS